MGKYVGKESLQRYKSELVGPAFEARQADYLDQLLRMLGTVGAQQSNRASEFAAYNNLPAASAAAMQRGIDYNTLLQGREGAVDLTNRANQLRMGNIQYLLGLQQKQTAAKDRAKSSFWGGIGASLGSIGAGLAYLFGNKKDKTFKSTLPESQAGTGGG